MTQALAVITPWITHPGGGDAVISLLVSPGLWPGETIQLASWGAVPLTADDVKREARALGQKALDGLRSLKTRDVAEAAGVIAADSVLHGVGAIESHQSVDDIGAARGPMDLSSPPEKAGTILALTSTRLVLLGVVTCVTQNSRGTDPIRWYAVHDVTTFPTPLPESIDIRFSWVRVLWERQLDLHVEWEGKRQVIRFNTYGIANAVERARAIAHAMGRDPGP